MQADVRPGPLAPRKAVALAALPRGNQMGAAEVVIRAGMTFWRRCAAHPTTRPAPRCAAARGRAHVVGSGP